jgi:hypothetical protein
MFMKKITIIGLFLLGVVIFYGCSQPPEKKEEKMTFAGTPLAEPKSDQPVQNQLTVEDQPWRTYIDKEAGFKIIFPESWKNFRLDQNMITGKNGNPELQTGFGGWRPNSLYLFYLFEEPKSTYKQLIKEGGDSEFSYAYAGEGKDKDKVIMCFGACCNGGEGTDKYGSLERERCAEVPGILKTFETVE